MSEKWGNGFGHFSAFFEFWTVFWAVLDTLVENATKNFEEEKNLNIDIWVPKMRFSSMVSS